MPILKQRIAIVTGAGSGIGCATALRFAREGAKVVAVDRDTARLNELESQHDSIECYACDVTDHDSLKRCVAETIKKHERIDILVNNAGISFYERHTASTLEHWRHTNAVNIEAMYALAKLAVPHMIARGYGRIVNVASIQAIAVAAEVGAYAATKGAVCAWSRALAVDLAEHNILVNVVAPGCIHTAMSIINGEDETESEYFQRWYVRERKIPLARPGTADEVANAILFLSGDQCTYITGHTLVVDGGLTVTF